jgi:predicted MFS family arabinose efflux permease
LSFVTTLKEEAGILIGGERGMALAAISGGWFGLIGTQMVYPVLLPRLRDAYDLNLTLAGVLLATIWLSQAVWQLPAGLMADRLDGRLLLVGSVIASITGLILVVFGGHVVVLFAGTALFGVGISYYGLARFTVIHHLFPDRLGASTGVIMAAADGGQTLLPPVASIVAISLSWEFGFGVMIPLLGLTGIWLWAAVPKTRQSGASKRSEVRRERVQYVIDALRRPAVVYGTALLVIYGTVWAGFTGFYPTYLVEVKGMSETAAALLFGMFFGIGIIVKPFAGSVYDRMGVRRILLALLAPPCFAFAAIPFVNGFVALGILTAVSAVVLGSGAVMQPYVLEMLPEDIMATGLAVTRATFLVIAALSPIFFGAIADRGFFDEIYLVFACLAGLNAILALRLPPR